MTHAACIHTKGSYSMGSLQPSFATVSPKLKDNPLSLSKKIWADKTVTWKLESDSPNILRDTELEIFRRVFTQIGLYIPSRIIQLNKSTADPDIKITFSKTDPYWTSMPSVLAYAYPPQTGIGGDLTFNTKSYIWTPDGAPMPAPKAYELGLIPGYTNPNNMIKTFKLPHTALHEGLHAMGVPHIPQAECPGAVMNPVYNGQSLMQKCDIDFLQSLYGTVNLSQEQIDDMIERFTAPYQ